MHFLHCCQTKERSRSIPRVLLVLLLLGWPGTDQMAHERATETVSPLALADSDCPITHGNADVHALFVEQKGNVLLSREPEESVLSQHGTQQIWLVPDIARGLLAASVLNLEQQGRLDAEEATVLLTRQDSVNVRQLVEKASGTDYDAFLTTRILLPLGMEDTFHLERGGRFSVHTENSRGEDPLCTTLLDLRRWLAALRDPSSVLSPRLAAFSGWQRRQEAERVIWEQSDTIEGTLVYVAWYPEEQLTVLLTGTAAAQQVLDSLHACIARALAG